MKKLKVRVITVTTKEFNKDPDKYVFFFNGEGEHNLHCFTTSDGVEMTTIYYAEKYDITEYNLHKLTLKEIKSYCKEYGIATVGETTVKSKRTKESLKVEIEKAEHDLEWVLLNKEEKEAKYKEFRAKYGFIKHNLDNLYHEDASPEYFFTILKEKGIEAYEKVWKKSSLNKLRLINTLLYSSNVSNKLGYSVNWW